MIQMVLAGGVFALTETERLLTLALALCPTLERDTLRKLIGGCGGADGVWTAPPDCWTAACKIRTSTVKSLSFWRATKDPVRLAEELRSQGICWTVIGEELYPQALLDLTAPPVVLFSNHPPGPAWFERSVSVVGTRRVSAYAVEAARWIADTLVRNGYTVISGMAVGVDGAAHTGTLNANGRTVAVLASGVDVCYPPQHGALFERIRQSGLVLSEYPPGLPVSKWRFPERNRLIAALSSKLVVVQAGDRSGALNTVDWALELGRDVYAVPGPITSMHFRGSNRLMQQGAHVVVDPTDILAHAEAAPAVSVRTFVPERWRDLYEALDTNATAASLASLLAVPLSHVFAGLLELEVAGLIRRGNGGSYEKIR